MSYLPYQVRCNDNLSFANEGYVLKWEDKFDEVEINTTNWVVAR